MSLELMDLMQVQLLAWARHEAGLTVEHAAKLADVPAPLIMAWEAGRASPSPADLKRLAKAYGRTLGVFFLPQPPLDDHGREPRPVMAPS